MLISQYTVIKLYIYRIQYLSCPIECDNLGIITRGSVIHKKYLYSSAILLPLTSVFMVCIYVMYLIRIHFFLLLYLPKGYLFGNFCLKLLHSIYMISLKNLVQVLPLPNIPFFWILFRTYSHWRASQVRQFRNFSICKLATGKTALTGSSQGSEKLLQLVGDASFHPNQSNGASKDGDSSTHNSDKGKDNSTSLPWVRISNLS